MLSRVNSNATHNLRRSKSTSSTTERRQHITTSETSAPETAKLYALVAARRAMGSSHQSTTQTLSRNESKRSVVAPTPRSVRFSSPVIHHDLKAKQKRVEAAKSNSPTISVRDAQHILPPPYHHVLLADNTNASAETYGAAPSSYRRLKTSTSLSDANYQGGKMLAVDRDTCSGQTATVRNAVSSSSLRSMTLRPRLKRSFFLLRSTKHRAEPLIPYQPELTCRPESIALARSQFLQSSSAQSTTTTPLTNRSGSVIKVALSQHTPTSPQAIVSETQRTASSPQKFPESEKRSISASLRQKFRKTLAKFRPTRNEIPPQQLTASHNHFQTDLTESTAEAGLDSYYNKNEKLERRRSLYVPSPADADPFEAIGDLRNNIRATMSSSTPTSTSQSRLTSWTNSSSSNSIRGNICEQKRLSVINEDGGPHQPSSSVGRHIGGVSVFQQPLRLDGNALVNNQRLYSALIRRIDEEPDGVMRETTTIRDLKNDQNSSSSNDSTNRAVCTLPSQTLSNNLERDKFIDKSSTNDNPSDKEIGRQPCSRQMQDKQSIFFASTTTSKPQTQSPFRKLLSQTREAKIGDESDDSDCGSVRVHRNLQDAKSGVFTESSDSLYSKTTNGGINKQYVFPSNSSESFLPPPGMSRSSPGIATIYPSELAACYQRTEISTPCTVKPSATLSEKGAWRGWLEGQISGIGRHKTGSKSHVREEAQIDPDDVELGRLPSSDLFNKALSATVCRSTEAGAHPSTPDPPPSIIPLVGGSPTISAVASKAGLPVALTDVDENRSPLSFDAIIEDDLTVLPPLSQSVDKHSQPTRKISPTKLAKGIQLNRSESIFDSSGIGKENRPTSVKTATQVSTLSLPKTRRSYIGSGPALRETSSNLLQETAKGRTSLAMQHPEVARNSPTSKYKNLLSARLSRPFDMDVPECNRPFDSTYLGHNENTSFPKGSGNERLSVATDALRLRPTKSYGGLGLSTLHPDVRSLYENEDTNTTALPRMPRLGPVARATSTESMHSSRKRMVSNFLRNRRKIDQDKHPEPRTGNSGSSPVFI